MLRLASQTHGPGGAARAAGPARACLIACVLAVLTCAVANGCGARGPASALVPNLLPTVELTGAPQADSTTYFTVQFHWAAFDPDGQVVGFVYAVDPPVAGDTAWTATVAHDLTLRLPAETPPNPLNPPGQYVIGTNAHTFVLRAIDNEGGESPTVSRSFTARTVAPETAIREPVPNRQIPVNTLNQLIITWSGVDPDGATRKTPVVYKYRLVPARAIDPEFRVMPGPAAVQAFFGKDAANGFAGWDSTTTTPGAFQATGLTAGTVYVFAVAARDEAGAWEPRFRLDANVLAFRPGFANLGPAITVSNQFFTQTQRAGGVSLNPARIADMECPAGVVLHCHWSARPTQGTNLAAFRWAIDLPDGDVADETPRHDDSDVRHWSNWALSETSADAGPFAGSADSTLTHFLYVEARDQIGFVSLFTLRIRIIVARLDRSLLVVDDMYGQLNSVSSGFPYPTKAEQDTFHFAVGGFPDRMAGGISRPGAFSAFDFDTLDYRFFGQSGIPLSVLGRYRVVAWYTDNFSSGAGGGINPTTGGQPNALRYINTTGHLNSLAAYVAQGGKAFLFGDGIARSIANGFAESGVQATGPAIPYSSSPAVPRSQVLVPGCFLYDFMHLDSELNTAGTATPITRPERLFGAIPYLPEFAGLASQTDRSHDPRIGPSAARGAARWEGLPRFTIASYRGAPIDPAERDINQTWYVSKPLVATEGVGDAAVSIVDTLYLLQARDYSLDGAGALSDGCPNGLDIHPSESGEIVWFGFPLYDFELDQARQAVTTVLRALGVQPRAPGAPPRVANAARTAVAR